MFGLKSIQQSSTLFILLLSVLCGCGKSESPDKNPGLKSVGEMPNSKRMAPIIDRSITVDQVTLAKKEPGEIRVLFIGNSHSAPIPRLLTGIFLRQKPETKTLIRTAPSFGFLADHAKVPQTLELIRKGNWDYVVLQAQKYSTTERYTYPTDGAMTLSKVASESGAEILMYPEWSRADVPDEYQRIKAIHDSIARKTGAKVAPIGEAWEEAIGRYEEKQLFASDGNHASEAGSYLNACVFYSMITGESPVRSGENRRKSIAESYHDLEQSAWIVYQADHQD